MNFSNQQFEEWRDEQIESLIRMGCPDAAKAFRDLGSIHWSAWEASRAALVIDLPGRCSYELQGMTDDANGDYLDYEETVAAIQLTGAKVK